MPNAIEKHTQIIFFDGVCGLCNGFIDFLIQKDKKQVFKFCSLQSEFAKGLLIKHKFDASELNTVVLLADNEVFIKSNAVLHILKNLQIPYSIFYYILFWIPQFFRDWVYDFISKYRYKLFGKKETCRIPNSAEIKRFL